MLIKPIITRIEYIHTMQCVYIIMCKLINIYITTSHLSTPNNYVSVIQDVMQLLYKFQFIIAVYTAEILN